MSYNTSFAVNIGIRHSVLLFLHKSAFKTNTREYTDVFVFHNFYCYANSNNRDAQSPDLGHFLPYFWQGRGRCLTRRRYADIAFFDMSEGRVIQAN